MNKTTIFDFDFISDNNFDTVLNFIKSYRLEILPHQLPIVITPNVDQIVKFNQEQQLKMWYRNSFLILPDGQPIVWLSKFKKDRLLSRLSGSDLFPKIWNQIKEDKERVLVITPSDTIGELLSYEYENCSYYSPPIFSLENKIVYNKIITDIQLMIINNNPKYVIVGIGSPNREYLTKELINLFLEKSPLFLLLGASFEFYLGIKKRAPIFFQKAGLEWLYRFLQEPKRLFRRYFIDSIIFVKIIYDEFRK